MDIFAEIRNEIGKRCNFKLRCNKKIPSIIYFSGVSIPISFDALYVNDILKNFYSGNNLFEVFIGDKKYLVVLKDFYKHPFKNDILHFDFQKVSLDDYVNVKIFFKFLGEKTAVGVKHGGFLVKNKLFVDVKCLASKLPNFIDVDISNLGVNESIFLNDLVIPDFIKIPFLCKKKINRVLIASIIGSRALEQKTQDAKIK